MKTVQLIGSKQLGGAERWFFRFSSALANRGCHVELGVRKQSDLTQPHLTHLIVHQLPFLTVWDPISRKAIAKLIQETKPAIVQTYMGRATRLTRIKKSCAPVHVARLGGYYKLDGYRHAHAWVANTQGLCDYLIQQGFPAHKVYHIYNFIEIPAESPADHQHTFRSSLGLQEDDIVLLSPGRFVPVKDHASMIKALAELPDRIDGRRVRVVLLGDGPLKEQLARLADTLHVQKQCVWPGWDNHPEKYYQIADLAVFPSRDEETLGNVILEAWAFRKPVVCTQFRGAREITEHGTDAWLVPCGNPEQLALGIESTLRDSALMRELAHNGFEKVKRQFSKGVVLDQYLKLYDELLT